MKRMTPKVLHRLVKLQNNIQITIYLPILPGPENTAKNSSALHHAAALLRKTMVVSEVPKENQQVLERHITKLEQLVTRPMSGESLAIFITNFNQLIVYEVPFAVESAIYFMAPNMQFEPLKKHYKDSAAYWVLALNQKGCSLLRGHGDHIAPVAADDIALDLKTALALDEIEPDIQAHAVGSQRGQVQEGFHGHGGFKDIRKKYLENYMRLIDKRLYKYLGRDTAPVFLVGLAGAQHTFQKVSRRKNILKTRVSFDARRLHTRQIYDALSPHITRIGV